MKKNGFTLVELLVVISIIAILSVIGITIFGSAQKSARDAKRKQDIEAISRAYEINKTATGYAVALDSWFGSAQHPKDPSGGEYWWSGAQSFPNTPCCSYTICADLENSTGNSSTHGDGANFTPATNGEFFCMKNLQ